MVNEELPGTQLALLEPWRERGAEPHGTFPVTPALALGPETQSSPSPGER